MSLEQGNTIAALVASNPVVDDKVYDGPGHFWLIKRVLKYIFPGAGGQGFAKPVVASEDDLNCTQFCGTKLEPDWRLWSFVSQVRQAAGEADGRLDELERQVGGLKETWPVGSIFISVATNIDGTPKSPKDLLGMSNSTWNLTAQGRTLIGVNTSDPDFSTVSRTGGTKVNTSTALVKTLTTSNQLAHQHNYTAGTLPGTATDARGAHDHTVVVAEPSGASFSVVQPYLTVFYWRRDA